MASGLLQASPFKTVITEYLTTTETIPDLSAKLGATGNTYGPVERISVTAAGAVVVQYASTPTIAAPLRGKTITLTPPQPYIKGEPVTWKCSTNVEQRFASQVCK
jgi:hypothetical protein